MTPDLLRGRRILVVEDDPLLSLTFEGILQAYGAEVVGPATGLEEAKRLAVANGLSAALLDIRLNGTEVWPAAQILAERDVPFVFCTGHFNKDTMPPQWLGRPVLTKPARPDQIVSTLARLVDSGT